MFSISASHRRRPGNLDKETWPTNALIVITGPAADQFTQYEGSEASSAGLRLLPLPQCQIWRSKAWRMLPSRQSTSLQLPHPYKCRCMQCMRVLGPVFIYVSSNLRVHLIDTLAV
jgi:hypothetical protein